MNFLRIAVLTFIVFSTFAHSQDKVTHYDLKAHLSALQAEVDQLRSSVDNIGVVSGSEPKTAFISHLASNNVSVYTDIYVKNISDSTVTLEFELYNQAGEMMTDNQSSGSGLFVAYYNYTNYQEPSTGASLRMDLLPKQSAMIRLHLPNYTHGFGIIRWSSEDASLEKAVMAFGTHGTLGSDGTRSSILINRGMPF